MGRLRWLGALLAAGLGSGCLVQIEDCADASVAFREARAEVQRLAGRTGRAREVNVLVFEPDERKLIRARVPMWLAKKVYRIAEPDDEGFELDFASRTEDQVARQLRERVRLEELEKAGPGLLVEVEEEGGEQVLVWLR